MKITSEGCAGPARSVGPESPGPSRGTSFSEVLQTPLGARAAQQGDPVFVPPDGPEKTSSELATPPPKHPGRRQEGSKSREEERGGSEGTTSPGPQVLSDQVMRLLDASAKPFPCASVAASGSLADPGLLGAHMVRTASLEQLGGLTTLRLQLATREAQRVGVELRLEPAGLRCSLALDSSLYGVAQSARGELDSALARQGISAQPVEIARGVGGEHQAHEDARSPWRRSTPIDLEDEAAQAGTRRRRRPGLSRKPGGYIL